MEPDTAAHPTAFEAETILTVVLKLLGIYFLYAAILQSSSLMFAMIYLVQGVFAAGAVPTQVWAQTGVSFFSTILNVILAIILIQHGHRAAHWFTVRSDLNVAVVNPTQKWYRGTLALIGLWVLATQLPNVLYVGLFSALESFGVTPVGLVVSGVVLLVHSTAVLIVGFGLIFRAQRIGDWLYRVSGAAKFDEQSV